MSSSELFLRTQDVGTLLTALDRLYAPVSKDEFPAHLFGVLAELLPGTLATFDFVDLTSGQVETRIAPGLFDAIPAAEMEARVRAYLYQHPVLSHLEGRNSAVVMQLADVVSQREFHRTDLYNLCFRPAGIEHQIAAGLAWPGHLGGFTLNRPRSRDFTAYEVALVRHLRPHVERAFAAAVRLERRAGAFPPGDRLTAREEEVLRWLGAGKRDAEIAQILGISPRTVHKHVEHVFAKLGVETRTAAAAALLLAHGGRAVPCQAG